MDLLKNLICTQINEDDDPEMLPPDVMSELQKNIRDGAKDVQQKWANALELVHKAYEVAGVERPTPDMRKSWKQYEENLTYAVQQLAKFRGMDGDWRMSSAIFYEALEAKPKKFRVTYFGEEGGDGKTVEAHDIDEVIATLSQNDGYDAKVHKHSDNEARISFSRWGIKKNGHVEIRRI